MQTARRVAIVCCVTLLGGTSGAHAITITCTGSWALTINQSNLQGGAGSALTSTYETASNAGRVNIAGTQNRNDTWRVDVRRSDTTWQTGLVLSVRRTTNGTGTGSISGGTTYQAVGGTSQTFFSGAGNRSNVRVQLQLGGVSHAVPVRTYSTTVVVTVVDL